VGAATLDHEAVLPEVGVDGRLDEPRVAIGEVAAQPAEARGTSTSGPFVPVGQDLDVRHGVDSGDGAGIEGAAGAGLGERLFGCGVYVGRG
jgi:hypothetical protein